MLHLNPNSDETSINLLTSKINRFLFSASLFLSAGLLFIIQPMVAKVLLPIYGGTPAVWTLCMLFFQLLLLGAYGYVWILSRFKNIRRFRITHLSLCFLSLAMLPLAFLPKIGQNLPEIDILKDLVLQLGLPLWVVGASAPLLQYAFSQSKTFVGVEPYFLYVASNAGSLIALFSYPWLVERFSGVTKQFWGWNVFYLVYLGLVVYLLCALPYEPYRQFSAPVQKIRQLGWHRWIILSFISCSLMLGVTFYISTDIAATPLFWVLPLGLYLLSFILTFAKKPLIPHDFVQRKTLYFLLPAFLFFMIGGNLIPLYVLIGAHLVAFFMVALFCHGELARTKPPANELTLFYFCMSMGGVLAGLFNGVLAPHFFKNTYEYPLIFLLALLYLPILKSRRVQTLFVGMAILCGSLFISPWFKSTETLSQKRNFYGVKQVFSQAGAHVLMSQSTIHGFQVPEEEVNGTHAYFGATFPVVQYLQRSNPSMNTLVLGLGTGMMACQFRKDDKLKMVEIDQQVIDIATDPNLFTYLRDCLPHVELIRNDGLLAVTEAKDASHDLLVMDAFNSDAIPVHLLTREAFALYQQKLTKDGVILVNISNRHLNVLPVLTGAARKMDMILLHKVQAPNPRLGQFAAEWALLTTNERLAGYMMSEEGWRFVADAEEILWTNDYSNLFPLLKLNLNFG